MEVLRVPLRDAIALSPSDLPNYLPLFGINLDNWQPNEGESPPLPKLLTELSSGECELHFGRHDTEGRLIKRDITTVTCRIARHFREEERFISDNRTNPNRVEVLQEYRMLPNGVRKARQFKNSISEKLRSDAERADPRLAIIRALREELRITVSLEELVEELCLQPLPLTFGNCFTHNGLTVEHYFQQSKAFPKLYTDNYLIHYMLTFPDRLFEKRGYAEPRTNHVFRWRSTFTTTEELHENDETPQA